MIGLLMLLWQAPVVPAVPVTVPAPSIPVVLPEEPQSQLLRDVASRAAFVFSTRVIPKQGRIWNFGMSYEFSPRFTGSVGDENGKFAGGLVIRPVPRKR